MVDGVDCHVQVHHAVALDRTGRQLGDRAFPVTGLGYGELLDWLRGFGPVGVVGVESTGAYDANLTRFLFGAGVRVVEVIQPHAHLRRRRGKSDALDAEAAARKVLSGEATAIPKDLSGVVEAFRQRRLKRRSAVQARAAALRQLGELMMTAPTEVWEQLAWQTRRGQAGVRARISNGWQTRSRPPNSCAARWPHASTPSTARSHASTSPWSRSPPPPLLAPRACSASDSAMPATSSSRRARTSPAFAVRAPARTSAPWTPSRPRRGRPPASA
jgi:Transposase